jgi:hypothetical protein
MRRRYRGVLAAVALCGLLAAPGCAGKHVQGETPRAEAALQADAVVVRINELQAAVIQACGIGPTCQPGSLDTGLARRIVQACLDARTTLKAVPDGWRASVKAGWTAARAQFGPVANPAILAALGAADTVIGGL